MRAMKADITPAQQHAPWQDLRAYLEYEREEGRTRITITEATRQILWNRKKTPEQEQDAIAKEIAACTRCPLWRTRANTVPGAGNPRPELLFVGEAPGQEEDRRGLPFVGRSGALLTKMLENLGFSRNEVFIANILKCRPPDNRTPTPQEREKCLPFLQKQIDRLRPKVIVALGATALRGLLQTEAEISRSRGVWHEYRGIPLMPTYHPSYLLRNTQARFDTWDDMLKVLKHIGRSAPPPKKTPGKTC